MMAAGANDMPPASRDPPAGVGLGLGTSPPYFSVENCKKKMVSGPFETVGSRHDPLKLLKIGYSY